MTSKQLIYFFTTHVIQYHIHMNVGYKVGHHMKSRSRPRFGNCILQSIKYVPNVPIGLNKKVMMAKQVIS